MHITGIRTGRLEAPLITPFKTAIRTVEKIEDLTVVVETDGGLTGLGEAAPTAPLTGDTFISMENAIRAYIAPAITGMEVTSDPASLEMVFDKMKRSIARNTSAKAAVDIAVYDLFARIKGEPLYRALGGSSCENTAAGCSTGLSGGTSACAPFVETDITISVNPIPEMVRDSLKAAERGFHILKLKAGLDAKTDLERISEIRRAVGPKMRIRVDANQGWTPDSAVRIIRGMEDAGIQAELVEQPVRADDIEGLAFVTKHVDTKILADESVFSARDAREIIRMKAADFINIKLMKTGGIHEALCISRLAEEAGVECMMGCMLESGISVGAAAHLAVSRKNITMADLDGPVLASKNPYSGGPVYDGAVIRMNETPGIGIFMGTVPTGVSYGEK